MKRTDEQKVRKDVLGYLEGKYSQKFEVSESEWACNEGNGCPDAHIVTCYPLNNPEIKFRIDIFYGDSLEVQRDEYINRLLDRNAEQALEKILEPKFSLSEKSISLLASSIRLDKYQINELNFERVIMDYPEEVYLSIYLYLLENREEKKQEYIALARDIVARFAPLPVKELSLDFYFYNENAYNNKSPEEIRKIFSLNEGIVKDSKNCEKEWSMQFDSNELNNMDSIFANLESSIHEVNYKEKK